MARLVGQTAIAITLSVVWVLSAAAQAPAPAPADNTKVNERDRQHGAKTAEQQSNTKADVDITRRIRQALVADKQLSTNAHNVKIITRAGQVTLKGPVKTADEKQAVESKAREIAGASNVVSQLTVAGASGGSTNTTKTSASGTSTSKGSTR